MSTTLRSRNNSSERSQSTISRSTRRSSNYESERSRSNSRSSRSTVRSTSRSSSSSASRTSESSEEKSPRSKRSEASSRNVSQASSYHSRRSTPSTTKSSQIRGKSVESRKVESVQSRGWDQSHHKIYNNSGIVRWKKKEPSYKPPYPQNGLNAVKIEGVRRDTFDYYVHRRKVAEVKSRVDNRPPQIYPHVYYDMKKLRKRQEEQAMVQRNNHRLLSKLVVAMTTTRIDNVPKNRDTFLRNKKQERRRMERLMGDSRQSSSISRYTG